MWNDPTIAKLIALAKDEDFGPGDLSSNLLLNEDAPSRFEVVVKGAGVLAGREVAAPVLAAYDAALQIEWAPDACDGFAISQPPRAVATIHGPLDAALAAERVLLNFLQRLSGVATLTRKFVDAVSGTRAGIYDTRKTTPGWRKLEKYAVRCGGGINHREGLFDAVLIKDNHLAGVPTNKLAGFVFELLNRLEKGDRKAAFIEVEAQRLDQVEALLSVVGIDVILLDNFQLDDLRYAVDLRENLGLARKVAFEASGGVNLSTVRAIAETGVERISVGAITHSAVALDISLERV